MTDEQAQYDWNGAAQSEGGDHAEKIPNGVHDLEIIKLVYGKSDGTQFRSRAGDQQIMLILRDAVGREASLMITLSFKAGWVLAKILDAAGANLAAMSAEGVTPKSFEDEVFAEANLIGRRFRGEVKWSQSRTGGEYANITPCGRASTAEQTQSQPTSQPPAEPVAGGDDIPF